MIKKIIDLFNRSGKDRVEFKPAIRMQMTPHAHPVWIDSMRKVKNEYLVEMSTMSDKYIKKLTDMTDSEMSGLHIRLHSVYHHLETV